MRRKKKTIVAAVEAELLRRLRSRGALSRVQLARELNFAPSTAGIYVDRLIRDGFLLESAKADRELGRPPTLLALNPDGGRFVGVDFEAHQIMATAVDFSQSPLKQAQRSVLESDSVERILKKIEQAIAEVMTGDDRRVLGIGVGVPGVIDPSSGVVLQHGYPIKGWHDVPVGQRLGARFNTPVFVENNIRSMALAELWFGQGRGAQNFICLGVRTGLAAGIVIGGQLYYGANHLAGEIRGWSCPAPDLLPGRARGHGPWPCSTLESVASLSAILAALQAAVDKGEKTVLRGGGGRITFDDVVLAAHEGDPLVLSVLEKVASIHGWAMSQMNQMFNPEKIVLAGPLTALGDIFLLPLKRSVQQLSNGLYSQPPVIVNSTLGPFSGAIGAAAIALHQWKPV